MIRRVLSFTLAYVVIGLGTANLAGAAATAQGRTRWRLAGWVLSLAVFLGQIAFERIRRSEATRIVARDASLAVAVAAFLLALLGPVRTHWSAADVTRATLFSLVLWPIATGIPAYLAAWAVAAVFGKREANLLSDSRV